MALDNRSVSVTRYVGQVLHNPLIGTSHYNEGLG
jgi:hypothetical protein